MIEHCFLSVVVEGELSDLRMLIGWVDGRKLKTGTLHCFLSVDEGVVLLTCSGSVWVAEVLR